MLSDRNYFMGHPISYWAELESKAFELGVNSLIDEIAELRGKISFYESRIKDCITIMEKK